ncbi:cold-shock protein [Parasporobacterium paucivorans]|uniref:Cold shock protein, CspA family n=1 Tax=Parasporobacterium paucivorans DSM 15970 TaxID=1122934 RepID=A0A1M6F3F5_9FIRM|nr:cold shock domain-containing protein [Parasporobacterium paucivorans]SHI92264.1 Cold shock protein, CspA family [Parasporobacterium paucivorans DSM 15970]
MEMQTEVRCGLIRTLKETGGYGFIAVTDITPEEGFISAFFHSCDTQDFDTLYRGCPVEFNLMDTEKGTIAVNIVRGREPEERLKHGMVIFLSPEGKYGFIKADYRTERPITLFFHQDSLLDIEFRELCKGDIMQFYIVEGRKGPEAIAIKLIKSERSEDNES